MREFALLAEAASIEHEAANKTKVLEEVGHLHLTLFSAPLHVEHKGSEESEDNQHPSCRTGTIVEKEHDAASELKDDGHNSSDHSDASKSPGTKTHSDKLLGTGQIHEKAGATNDIYE